MQLYVFVDESGNTSHGSIFSVGSCWCFSHSAPTVTLKHTVGMVKSDLNNMYGYRKDTKEIKFSKLSEDAASYIPKSAKQHSYDDRTLLQPENAWYTDSGQLIRYSTSCVNPQLLKKSLVNAGVDEPDAPQLIRVTSLTRTLQPLFTESKINANNIDTVRIVLDANVWKNSSEAISKAIQDEIELPFSLEFEIADSHSCYGIQLADVVAGLYRKNHLDGSHGDGISELQGHSF